MSRALEALGPWLDWLALGSLASFLLGILLIPLIILRLPEDYFDHRRRKALPLGPGRALGSRLAHALLVLVKNLSGILLVLIGIVLLVLPGQGLLSILLGISLLDFPGKYRLEQRLIRQPRLLRSINWLRRRYARPPLRLSPPGVDEGDSAA